MCRWLYCLFLAIDANFRLKLKAREIGDPELGTGLAYFVDTFKFQKHLQDRVDEEDVSGLRVCLSDRSKLSLYICRSRPAEQSSMQSIKQIQGYQKTSRFLVSAQSSAVTVSCAKTVLLTFKKASGRSCVSHPQSHVLTCSGS